MKKIVECVPNFSEGRNKDVINAIARAIRETKGCTLLDVDPGASTHRTVYTFVGDPEAVVEGAWLPHGWQKTASTCGCIQAGIPGSEPWMSVPLSRWPA